MKRRMLLVTTVIATILVVMSSAVGAIPGALAPEAPVAGEINYQGRLTDPAGVPLDGTFSMRFQVHDDPVVNSPLWDSYVVSVDVDHGLFNVALAVDPSDFNGQGLWLRIYVDGEWLTPRQELLPVPYALSLRPGAKIERTNAGNALEVANVATGTALWAASTTGFGVYGYSENSYGVFGVDSGTTQGKGYGGYFTSNTGIGVYGYSSATSTTSNAYTPGVYGRSANGVGVLGLSDAGDPGVLGMSDGHGVSGRSEHSHGVRGSAGGPATDEGYGGYFTSENYRGLYASGDETFYAAVLENPAGSGGPGLLVDGSMWVTGSKTGYVVDTALNEGPEPLETGDVVIVTGFGEPVAGEIPVIMVRIATEAESTGVVGIVDQPYTVPTAATQEDHLLPKPAAATAQIAEGTEINSGEYLSVVTHGAFKAIKVDASYGAIRPGDLLVSSPNPGYAMRAADPRVGTVLGKAMSELSEGTGTIPVLITSQ